MDTDQQERFPLITSARIAAWLGVWTECAWTAFGRLTGLQPLPPGHRLQPSPRRILWYMLTT